MAHEQHANKYRKAGFEIDTDPQFQEHSWRWQRVGWGVMALLLLAAMLGLFGSGWLDKREVGQRGSQLWLACNRFGRLQAETSELQIHLGPGAGTNGRARIWINREFMEGMQVMALNPQPESVEAGAERFTYVFNVPDAGQPTVVTFHLEPQKVGRVKGQVGLENGPSLSFSQFIYP